MKMCLELIVLKNLLCLSLAACFVGVPSGCPVKSHTSYLISPQQQQFLTSCTQRWGWSVIGKSRKIIRGPPSEIRMKETILHEQIFLLHKPLHFNETVSQPLQTTEIAWSDLPILLAIISWLEKSTFHGIWQSWESCRILLRVVDVWYKVRNEYNQSSLEGFSGQTKHLKNQNFSDQLLSIIPISLFCPCQTDAPAFGGSEMNRSSGSPVYTIRCSSGKFNASLFFSTVFQARDGAAKINTALSLPSEKAQTFACSLRSSPN